MMNTCICLILKTLFLLALNELLNFPASVYPFGWLVALRVRRKLIVHLVSMVLAVIFDLDLIRARWSVICTPPFAKGAR